MNNSIVVIENSWIGLVINCDEDNYIIAPLVLNKIGKFEQQSDTVREIKKDRCEKMNHAGSVLHQLEIFVTSPKDIRTYATLEKNEQHGHLLVQWMKLPYPRSKILLLDSGVGNTSNFFVKTFQVSPQDIIVCNHSKVDALALRKRKLCDLYAMNLHTYLCNCDPIQFSLCWLDFDKTVNNDRDWTSISKMNAESIKLLFHQHLLAPQSIFAITYSQREKNHDNVEKFVQGEAIANHYTLTKIDHCTMSYVPAMVFELYQVTIP